MPTPLTDIIPPGKKLLLKNLQEAKFTTLEDCAARGEELYKVWRVGSKTIIALKEHCFRRKIYWQNSSVRIADLAVHFASRYKLDPKNAQMVAEAFFWDNSYPSSLSTMLF